MQDTDLMLHTLLELGESMLADGADVRRVEQTLSRMGKAYGAVRMDVFVITSSIVLTMCFADGSAATQTRRIEKSAMTDFCKLEAINAISRSYCEHPFPVPELYDRLQLAKRCEPARWKLFAGSCLAAGALAAFFGGTALDGLAAGLFALVLCVLQIVLPPLCKNKVLFNFLSAFAVGGLICLACRLVPALHSDKVIIGDIMLLIPGLAFTNAVKDIFIGDTISGVMRLIETILWAATLALGFALAGWLLGGVAMSNFMTLLTALLGSAGFALLFNVRKQLLPLAALGGALCWGAYLLAGVWTQSVFVQSFAASAVTAVWSEILARVKKTPAQQYLIVGLIPLVPGATLYYAMSAVVQQDWAQAQFHGYRVTAFVLGIAAGVSLTLSLFEMLLHAVRHAHAKKQR